MAETLYASLADYVQSNNAVYATAVAGANLAVGGGANLLVGQDSGFYLWQGFVAFDLSAYQSGGTAANPVFSLYLGSGPWNSAHTTHLRDHDFGATITTADWQTTAPGTLLATRASVGTGAGYNVFTDSALGAAIESALGGTLRLWLCTSSFPADDTNTGNTIWANATGAPNAPRLVFDYTAPAAAGDPMGAMGFFG